MEVSYERLTKELTRTAGHIMSLLPSGSEVHVTFTAYTPLPEWNQKKEEKAQDSKQEMISTSADESSMTEEIEVIEKSPEQNNGTRKRGRPKKQIQEPESEVPEEIIHADTDTALTMTELVTALDIISEPTEIESVPLSVDPDDYPVV